MTAPSVHSTTTVTDHVSGEQYRYALTNFVRPSYHPTPPLTWLLIHRETPLPPTQAIAHQKVEEQRAQLEEQERQIARLQARIATLEGSPSGVQPLSGPRAAGGSSVDDFSIKVRAQTRNSVPWTAPALPASWLLNPLLPVGARAHA